MRLTQVMKKKNKEISENQLESKDQENRPMSVKGANNSNIFMQKNKS